MTDTPKPSQEDAQQIAALNARVQELEEVQDITAQETERLFAENAQHQATLDQVNKQIAALRAELEMLEDTYVAALNRERTKCEAAEAQLTALQAEQAQWQRRADALEAAMNPQDASEALAALTAQQEKPQP